VEISPIILGLSYFLRGASVDRVFKFRMIKALITKIKNQNPAQKKNAMLFLSVGAAVGLIIVIIFFGSKDAKKIIVDLKNKSEEETDKKNVGILTGNVNTKSYVQRIEKQYYDMDMKTEMTSDRLDKIEKVINELRVDTAGLGKMMLGMDNKIEMGIEKRLAIVRKQLEQNESVAAREKVTDKGDYGDQMIDYIKGYTATEGQAAPRGGLEMTKVGEIDKTEKREKAGDYVYLPAGSFVKGVLLTGVYAPANEGNPLPVLLSVQEAFYGPNNSRVPLRGMFAIGKAYGDTVSRRAIVQVNTISVVMDNGKVFEHNENIGYLADMNGQLGIPGELIYSTGKQLSLNFLSGFLSGATEALAQTETTTSQNAYGTSNKNVTGDSSKYAMFSGISSSAEGLSDYYAQQLENMVPAVKINAGVEVIFVVQNGCQIEGLEINKYNLTHTDG